MRRPPVWAYALAVSLLLHAALLIAVLDLTPRDSGRLDAVPIEARLVAPPPRPVVPSKPPVPRRAPSVVEPMPVDERVAAVDAPDHGPEPELEDAAGVAAAPVESEPEAERSSPAPDPQETPLLLNALPPRIDMRFEVRYGIARGEQTLVWVRDGDTYTVTSVAAATGLAGIFYSGRFVQTSQGRVTSNGLAPELFWDQRGDRRSSARFDAANGMLTYSPARGAPRQFALRRGAQDTLSLFFQLALTAPPEAAAVHQVFNGRRVRDYAYAVRGETQLDTALGPLRTLHLARMADEDGRFEVWLAIDRHYLPVRVLRTDDKGNEVELTVASIAP